jgi:uncharacterized protein with ParB-like and HNH nuclease domain
MPDEREAYLLSHGEPDDIELEEIESEAEDYDSGPAEYDVATYPADFTLEVLNDKWKAGDIEVPRFQRDFVWKQTQASKLIESFMVGLPVPAVFLYTQRKSQKYLVIDGQQRLKSVFYFLEGYFGGEEQQKRGVFRLEGLSEKSKWYKKTFAEFDEPDQRKLKNSVLRAFIVQQLDPQDDTSVYHIFERLNTGGTLLTNQEVRNCVYGGKFNDLLNALNNNADWRAILGRVKEDSRQKDKELMLRFFSLHGDKIKAYEKPLKDFLNRFMRRNRNPTDEVLKQLRSIFEDTCSGVAGALGEKPFHIKAGLNSAVFDSVMSAFSSHLNKIPKDVKERYKALVNNPDYLKLVTSGTTNDETVRKRFDLAEQLLFR